MARKFLTPIDLNKLELQNAAIQNLGADPSSPVAGQIYYNTVANKLKLYNGTAWVEVGNSQEEIEDAVANLIVAGTGISETYNDESGTLTIANTGVTSIAGTANEVTVSASAGAVTVSLPDTINANLNGNAASATYAVTAGTANAVAANSVALGTDTTGNYVATISAGTGISVSGSGSETASVTITNGGVVSATGTTNQVNVSASVGAVTFSLPQDIHSAANPTFGGVTAGNVRVGITGDNEIDTSSGNLTIDSTGGTTTIDDDVVITGTLTVSGSATYVNTEVIELADNTIILNSNATGSASQDAGIEVERGDNTNVAIVWNETNDVWTLTNNGTNYHNIVRKYSTDVGNSASTVYTVTHNLGTRDVIVNVYDNVTYDTVEVDIARTSTSVVTLTFAVAPSTNAYRVVISG